MSKKKFSLNFWGVNYESTKQPKNTNKKRDTYRGFKSQLEHDYREETEQVEAEYLVRPELTKDNITWSKFREEEKLEEEYQKVIDDYQDTYKRKIPKNTKKLINGLITFPPDMREDIEKVGRKEMLKILTDFIKEEYGEVLHYSLHFDESSIHIHFMCLNWNFKTHKAHTQELDASLRDKNNKYRQNFWQDKLQTHLNKSSEHLEDYERGDIRSIKKFKDDIQDKNEYIKKLKDTIKQLESEASVTEKKLNIQINQLEKELNTMKEETEESRIEILKLNNELEGLLNDLEGFIEEESDKGRFEYLKELWIKYKDKENVKKLTELTKKVNRTSKAIKKKYNKRER